MLVNAGWKSGEPVDFMDADPHKEITQWLIDPQGLTMRRPQAQPTICGSIQAVGLEYGRGLTGGRRMPAVLACSCHSRER